MHIILIHGLGRTPLAMSLLGRRLRKRQYTVRSFGYAAFYQPFDAIVRRFVATIRSEVGPQPYVIIGHSLGNIIARASLPALADLPPQRLVMLAPPNQPPLLAKAMGPNPLFRLMSGECGKLLADDAFYARLPVPDIPTTIIAGTAGPRGQLSPFGNRPNDCVVAVEETRLGPGCEVCLVPAIHTFIMNSPKVTAMIMDVLGS